MMMLMIRRAMVSGVALSLALILGCPGMDDPADDLCGGVMCADGETCVDDVCEMDTADLCGGVMCADGETCVDDVCEMDTADLCGGVMCADGETCVDDVCVGGTPEPDAAAGEEFAIMNGCTGCHGADAAGTDIGPPLFGATAELILDKFDGTVFHVGEPFPDATAEDAANVAAWVASIAP